MDAWLDGCMDGWMHGWMDAYMNECAKRMREKNSPACGGVRARRKAIKNEYLTTVGWWEKV